MEIQRHLRRPSAADPAGTGLRSTGADTRRPPGWLARIGVRRRRRPSLRTRPHHLAQTLADPVARISGGVDLVWTPAVALWEFAFLPLAISNLLAGPFSLVIAFAVLVDLAVIAGAADWHNDTYEVTRMKSPMSSGCRS